MLACGIRFYIQSLPGGLDEPAMETINHYRCCSLVDQHRIRNQWCEFHWTFVESFVCSSDPDRREQRALLRRYGPGARSSPGSGTASDVGRGVQAHQVLKGIPVDEFMGTMGL